MGVPQCVGYGLSLKDTHAENESPVRQSWEVVEEGCCMVYMWNSDDELQISTIGPRDPMLVGNCLYSIIPLVPSTFHSHTVFPGWL